MCPTLLRALGYNLGLCLSLQREHKNPIDFSRLRRDIRIAYQMHDVPDSDFNRKLYVPNTDWNPDPAPTEVENSIDIFETATAKLFSSSRKLPHIPNISQNELQALKNVKVEGKYVVQATDKNLGPCIMEKTKYIHRALNDHLLDSTNYNEITKEKAELIMVMLYKLILANFVDDKGDPTLDKDSITFFERKLCGPRDSTGIVQIPAQLQLPYFYILPKVHKTPWKTRPVVSQVSSVIEPLSQWIDYQLQRVIHLCPSYLQDTWHFLHELKKNSTKLLFGNTFHSGCRGYVCKYSNCTCH